MGCAKGVGGQFFCFPDDRHRVAEVVQRLHAVHVHAHTLLAQKGGQLRVAPASLVAGHIKGHHTHLPEPLQRFVNGRAALVQPEPCTVLTHLFFLRPWFQDKQKSAGAAPKSADLRLEKAIFCAEKAPGQDVPEPRAAFQHDPKRRDDESLYSNSAFTALY